MNTTPLKVAGSVFFLVGAVHLARVVLKFDLVIGSWAVPIWVNGVGSLVAFSLCYWMFKTAKQN